MESRIMASNTALQLSETRRDTLSIFTPAQQQVICQLCHATFHPENNQIYTVQCCNIDICQGCAGQVQDMCPFENHTVIAVKLNANKMCKIMENDRLREALVSLYKLDVVIGKLPQGADNGPLKLCLDNLGTFITNHYICKDEQTFLEESYIYIVLKQEYDYYFSKVLSKIHQNLKLLNVQKQVYTLVNPNDAQFNDVGKDHQPYVEYVRKNFDLVYVANQHTLAPNIVIFQGLPERDGTSLIQQWLGDVKQDIRIVKHQQRDNQQSIQKLFHVVDFKENRVKAFDFSVFLFNKLKESLIPDEILHNSFLEHDSTLSIVGSIYPYFFRTYQKGSERDNLNLQEYDQRVKVEPLNFAKYLDQLAQEKEYVIEKDSEPKKVPAVLKQINIKEEKKVEVLEQIDAGRLYMPERFQALRVNYFEDLKIDKNLDEESKEVMKKLHDAGHQDYEKNKSIVIRGEMDYEEILETLNLMNKFAQFDVLDIKTKEEVYENMLQSKGLTEEQLLIQIKQMVDNDLRETDEYGQLMALLNAGIVLHEVVVSHIINKHGYRKSPYYTESAIFNFMSKLLEPHLQAIQGQNVLEIERILNHHQDLMKAIDHIKRKTLLQNSIPDQQEIDFERGANQFKFDKNLNHFKSQKELIESQSFKEYMSAVQAKYDQLKTDRKFVDLFRQCKTQIQQQKTNQAQTIIQKEYNTGNPMMALNVWQQLSANFSEFKMTNPVINAYMAAKIQLSAENAPDFIKKPNQMLVQAVASGSSEQVIRIHQGLQMFGAGEHDIQIFNVQVAPMLQNQDGFHHYQNISSQRLEDYSLMKSGGHSGTSEGPTSDGQLPDIHNALAQLILLGSYGYQHQLTAGETKGAIQTINKVKGSEYLGQIKAYYYDERGRIQTPGSMSQTDQGQTESGVSSVLPGGEEEFTDMNIIKKTTDELTDQSDSHEISLWAERAYHSGEQVVYSDTINQSFTKNENRDIKFLLTYLSQQKSLNEVLAVNVDQYRSDTQLGDITPHRVLIHAEVLKALFKLAQMYDFIESKEDIIIEFLTYFTIQECQVEEPVRLEGEQMKLFEMAGKLFAKAEMQNLKASNGGINFDGNYQSFEQRVTYHQNRFTQIYNQANLTAKRIKVEQSNKSRVFINYDESDDNILKVVKDKLPKNTRYKFMLNIIFEQHMLQLLNFLDIYGSIEYQQRLYNPRLTEFFQLKGAGDDEKITDYCCYRHKHQVLSSIINDPEKDEMVTLLSLQYLANLHSSKMMCHRDIKYQNIFFNMASSTGKTRRGERAADIYTDCDTVMLVNDEKSYVVDVYQPYSSKNLKEKVDKKEKVSRDDLINDDAFQYMEMLKSGQNRKQTAYIQRGVKARMMQDPNLTIEQIYKTVSNDRVKCKDFITQIREKYEPNISAKFWKLFQHSVHPAIKSVIWSEQIWYQATSNQEFTSKNKSIEAEIMIMFIQDNIVEIVKKLENDCIPSEMKQALQINGINCDWIEVWRVINEQITLISEGKSNIVSALKKINAPYEKLDQMQQMLVIETAIHSASQICSLIEYQFELHFRDFEISDVTSKIFSLIFQQIENGYFKSQEHKFIKEKIVRVFFCLDVKIKFEGKKQWGKKVICISNTDQSLGIEWLSKEIEESLMAQFIDYQSINLRRDSKKMATAIMVSFINEDAFLDALTLLKAHPTLNSDSFTITIEEGEDELVNTTQQTQI